MSDHAAVAVGAGCAGLSAGLTAAITPPGPALPVEPHGAPGGGTPEEIRRGRSSRSRRFGPYASPAPPRA
ncbi:hypothetical protein [Kitasatospora sp. NPDC058218]|uniref:hypothetical protein n=1 Tax=Kitasatospora sp. NPDC058218 TaxID=3346385 RepID=UPI0036DC03E3